MEDPIGKVGVGVCVLLQVIQSHCHLMFSHVLVAILVTNMKQLLHSMLYVEPAGLPVLHLREVDNAISIFIQILELAIVIKIFVHVVFVLPAHGLVPLIFVNLSIFVDILCLEDVLHMDLKNLWVRLRVHKCNKLMLV